MKKIIFIHGYTSSPKEEKYRIISKELDALGVDYSIPALPGGEHPHSKKWLEIIDKEIKSTSKPIILVGYSIGSRAALLYLDKFKQRVDTVLLIAAFNSDVENNRKRQSGNYANFFEYPLDLEKIKKLANRFIVMHSKDDSSIDYQQGVDISKGLDAKLITYKDRDHLGGPENVKYWLEVIKSLL